MTIQQVKYVLALDTYRHFIKAAESCFVTQSTLTIQVKKLEDEIGTVLFDRTKQPLKPTPLGEKFIGKARQIERELRELKEMFSQEFSQTNGTFRIGIIPTLSPYLLPLFIGEFLKNHPETKLDIEELESENIIESINHGRLDIGIVSTPLNEPNIREISLFYEPFLLYANERNEILFKKGKVEVSQLKSDEIWLLKQGHCFRNQMLNFCDFSKLRNTRNLVLEGGSVETLKRMIKETFGYTLIPELSFEKNSDTDFVRRFKEPEPAREISFIVQKNFTKKRLLSELKMSILEGIPKKFKTNNKYVTVKWR
ncbi:MAG: LysR family transcriptional regulator [Bacteroidetes bacterium]|nr:LysR family transcriptional regulator [Bacteroidota bacterium]MBS1932337.1 LysR family transcriptional regulator [Bacteroidota bacterium]